MDANATQELQAIKTELQSIINECGLSKIVRFEGWVSGDKKVELLNNTDVFILPSYTEGLPISILEAMSYRLPVISTPVGGIPEVVRDGENGFLIKPGDKDALHNAIVRLANDEELREKMGNISYSKVQPHLPEIVAKELEDIYKKLVKEENKRN